MRTLTTILLATVLAGLPGCDRQGATLESFKEQWYAAVNLREPERLYFLLDARSRRMLDEKLETLRGLDKQEDQQVVINWLGGDRVSDLHQLSNERFFALWWRRVTEDKPPTMVIEAAGGQAAYMTISLNGRDQRIELKQEAGRWVWVLPPQRIHLPDIPAQADANAPAPAKP